MSHRSESIQKPARITTKLQPFGETVFSEINRLAMESGAVNLGQGCPDFDAPDFIREAARDAINSGHNQYPPMGGAPVLTQAIADDFQATASIQVDPAHEITVTCGCTEAIAACLIGLLEPGDEVIVMDPVYDSYRPCLAMAGAIPRALTLKPPHFELDAAAIDALCTEKTRAVMLNTPHNPTGRVFTPAELEALADVCRRRDLIVLSDEVYHRMVYEGRHISIASLPGMYERTITLNSLGKTFSVTGWKIGYVTGPAHLMETVAKTHQFVTFTTAPGLQSAVAYGLAKDDDYFASLASSLEAKRDILAKGLADAGFDVLPADGTYFISADFRPLGFNGTDEEFCREITMKAKVAAIPLSAFYSSPDAPRHLARFCFCKQDAILEEASARLKAFARGGAA